MNKEKRQKYNALPPIVGFLEKLTACHIGKDSLVTIKFLLLSYLFTLEKSILKTR